MAKSDNENPINNNIQSNPDESNPPPILTPNNIPSLDFQSILADSNNNIIILPQKDVENGTAKEENGELNESNAVLEVVNVEKSDNAVLRKLLRGSRYFDPPDNNWGNCSNCRGTGHTVGNCTAAKRKRPCYVCGSFEHLPKWCKKGKVCSTCKQSGHRPKHCPEKFAEGIQKVKLCLKCGDSGHDMFACRTAYSPDDLKEIRCYICKSFGHLCCLDYGRELGVVSCFTCGQLGHTGLECTCSSDRQKKETANKPLRRSCNNCGDKGHKTHKCPTSALPSSCNKCGDKGHETHKCPTLALPSSCNKCGDNGHEIHKCPTLALPSSCNKCGDEGHKTHKCPTSANKKRTRRRYRKGNKGDVGVNSALPELGESCKRIKAENGSSNSSQPKRRGGWINEDLGDHQNGTQRGSPSAPVTYRPKNSFHEYHYPPGLQYEASGSNGHRQHRLSASRFGNSSNHERKEYSWDN